MKIRSSLAIAAAVAALLCEPASALATDVSGTIVNQTWTSNNSPYRVLGNILVAGLTIKPGVTVLFDSNYVFEVAGRLQAVGTPDASIVFRATNNGWQGIYFNVSSPGSALAYCAISNSVNSGIRILNSNPSIDLCVIANNSGVNGGGIYANIASGDLVVLDCVISNNTSTLNGGGVSVILSPSNTLRMDGCFVSGNVANPTVASGGGWLYVGGGIAVSGSSLLQNCVLRNNTCYALSGFADGSGQAFGGGLYSDTGYADLRNCIVSGNQTLAYVAGGASVAFGGGIFASSGSLTLANSIISSNGTSASIVSGGGVYLQGAVQNSSVVNCTLAYNNSEGISSEVPQVSVLDSIVFFNNSGGTQIVGPTNVTYSDVQNGFAGQGNISGNPIFLGTDNPIIVPGSPCIDNGSTNTVYKDQYFPPSLGSSRNDMGAHGGPGAGARFRIRVNPQVEVAMLGGVPGYNYLIQASTNLLDWQTVQAVSIAHVGDVSYYLEPTTNTLPVRFYKLNLAP